jgi:hypothetical protein
MPSNRLRETSLPPSKQPSGLQTSAALSHRHGLAEGLRLAAWGFAVAGTVLGTPSTSSSSRPNLSRMGHQVVRDADRCGRAVSDRQDHVTGSRVVVDVPPVVAGKRSRIGCEHRCIVVYRLHVLLGVVVPVQGVVAVVSEAIDGGGQDVDAVAMSPNHGVRCRPGQSVRSFRRT